MSEAFISVTWDNKRQNQVEQQRMGEQNVKLNDDEDEGRSWTWKAKEKATFDRVVALYNDGVTNQREIAEALGVDKSTVSRHLGKARKKGQLT